MKKFILTVIVSVFTFSSFAMQATVISAKGKAEVQSGGSWVPLKSGDSLNQGSVIQTGFKSELVLKIKESTVTVAPLSRITLQSLIEREGLNGSQGKDETTIFLDTGSLRSNVQKSADRRVGFTVRSPVATASVRGTVFGLKTRYRAVKLTTSRGRVAFWKNTAKSERSIESPKNDDKEFTADNAIFVAKGERADAPKGGAMRAPSQVFRNDSKSLGPGARSAADAEIPPAFHGVPGFAGPEPRGGPKSGAGRAPKNDGKKGFITVKVGM